MKIYVEIDGRPLDFKKACEISLPIDFTMPYERAWYIGPPKRVPVQMGSWVGSTELGGSVNFFNLLINPHAHGTHIETSWHIDHTECVQPIVNQLFYKTYLFTCKSNGDHSLDLTDLWGRLTADISSLVLRTLPNEIAKRRAKYSDTNPPYLRASDAARLALSGISVLLIDLPSIDPERDSGVLAAHREFWTHQPKDSEASALIGEFLYIPDTLLDGEYALHIQHPSMYTDAVPARIFLIPYL